MLKYNRFFFVRSEENERSQTSPESPETSNLIKQLAAPIKLGAVAEAPVKKEVESFFDVKRENITVIQKKKNFLIFFLSFFLEYLI